MTNARYQRFREAYLMMAQHARHRPACGDALELGNPVRLEQEANAYAAQFLREDDEMDFPVGCSDFSTNSALVYVIEAARVLCDGSDGKDTALRLLRLAIDDVKSSAQKARTTNEGEAPGLSLRTIDQIARDVEEWAYERRGGEGDLTHQVEVEIRRRLVDLGVLTEMIGIELERVIESLFEGRALEAAIRDAE